MPLIIRLKWLHGSIKIILVNGLQWLVEDASKKQHFPIIQCRNGEIDSVQCIGIHFSKEWVPQDV